PASESERITALLQLLRARRCLLVLDNSETLLEPGQREGRYRAGMDGYGQFRRHSRRQRSPATFGSEAPQPADLVVDQRHAEPVAEHARVQSVAVVARERHALLALAGALRLDRPAGAQFQLSRVNLQRLEDHSHTPFAPGRCVKAMYAALTVP